jgi:hypothetical protein
VARLVAWGRSAEQIVAIVSSADGPVVAVFDTADLRVERHVNVAGEPRDTVYFDGAVPRASGPAGSSGIRPPANDQARAILYD